MSLSIRKVFFQTNAMKVPQAEALILEIVLKLDKPANGVEIARQSNGVVSLGSVYSLLERLGKRGLVNKVEAWDQSGAVPIRRVNYVPAKDIEVKLQRINSPAIEAPSASMADFVVGAKTG